MIRAAIVRSFALGCCSWLALAAPCLRAADEAPLDAAESRLREVLSAKLEFAPFVFGGEALPGCEFEDPARLRELIGPYTIKSTYHDRAGRRVEVAEAAGPYRVVAEVVPESGRPLRRMATLFKTSVPLDHDWHFAGDRPAALLQLVCLGSSLPYVDLVGDQLKGRSYAEFSRDPAVARLLAGLSMIEVGDLPLRNAQDAVTLDRQAWVDLKRRLDGLDRAYPRPFVGPRRIEGEPAPVLRVGTLAEAGFRPGAVEGIDAICRAWAADSDQAFAVCIARHGVIVLHNAYGARDGRPMTVDTTSWMASVTKAMSATLMMMLVDRGLVDLDAPVETYLPAFRGVAASGPLTVRHLYTHTGGLDRWPGWADELADVEDRVAAARPLLKVGGRWAYNGLGNTLGSKIVENLTGEALPLSFRNHLLGPLGCTNTEVYGSHADARSIPLDMAKFGQMLLNGGAYGSWRFFSPETFKAMLPERLTKVLGPDAAKVFGIGLDGRPERFGHGAASTAMFSVDRLNDLVVIITRNKDGRNWERYQGRFTDAVRAGLEPPFRESP